MAPCESVLWLRIRALGLREPDREGRPKMLVGGSTTVEDLERMEPNANRYELRRGVLHRMAAAGGTHGEVAHRFSVRLGVHVDERGLGLLYSSDTGFVVGRGPDTVLMPDVSFVRADRVPAEEDSEGIVRAAPNLVMEVVSPSDRATEVADKVALYRGGGVRLVLVAEPRRRVVRTHRPGVAPVEHGEGDILDLDDVVPGFRMPVADVFTRPPLRGVSR